MPKINPKKLLQPVDDRSRGNRHRPIQNKNFPLADYVCYVCLGDCFLPFWFASICVWYLLGTEKATNNKEAEQEAGSRWGTTKWSKFCTLHAEQSSQSSLPCRVCRNMKRSWVYTQTDTHKHTHLVEERVLKMSAGGPWSVGGVESLSSVMFCVHKMVRTKLREKVTTGASIVGGFILFDWDEMDEICPVESCWQFERECQ